MLTKSLMSISLFVSMGTFALVTPVSALWETAIQIDKEQKTAISIITNLPKPKLETIVRGITVKVHVGEYRGSGILIKRENNSYTVITNAHVVDRGDIYRIETLDGVKHTANLLSKDDSQTGSDLATLEFNSSNKYQLAELGDSNKLSPGETVIAAGFPFDADKLKITWGEISLLPAKSLEGGYQIGFTNETKQGMSGGVLLNSSGELIGVLGKGKGAIFDTAYTYQDGTNPTVEELAKLRDVSFSIPIAKAETQLASILPQTQIAQTPQQTTETPTKPKQYTGIVGKVDKIAEQITVRIDNLTNKSNGSGVIIAKQGNSYYVATAKHVLCNELDTPECEANGQHQIVTPNGVSHKIDYQTVKASGTWLDVAVFRFESSNNYSVATLGKYDVGGKWVFVSGFPGVDSTSKIQPSRVLTGGKVKEEESKYFTTKDAYSLKSNGEGLVYTNMSYPGMSGGAVLDTQGRLVGINTGAELDYTTGEGLNLGYSLGVKIQDFLGLVQKGKMELKTQWFQTETNPTSEITKAEITTVKEQLLTTTEPNIHDGVAAWMNYGNQLWRYERNVEAVSAFEKVIELKPNFDRAYYSKGLAFRSQRKNKQAAIAFKTATEINPVPYYYWRYLGLSYFYLNKYAEAKSAYDTAIIKNSEDFVLYVERGRVLGYSLDYQGAIESYNQAIKLKSDHPRAYNGRAIVYSRLKQEEKAIADFTRLIDISPYFAGFYSNRGFVYKELKEYDKAISDFNKAIEIDRHFTIAYFGRGTVYIRLKQHEQAITDFTRAIEINPKSADTTLQKNERTGCTAIIKTNFKSVCASAYNHRGVSYAVLKQDKRAIADYTKAIEINPQLAEAYHNRGISYRNLKQYKRAITDYTKEIEIHSQYMEAYHNRGISYRNLKQYIEAYVGRGISYRNLKQYDKAIADYTQALQINPSYAEVYFIRGAAYAELKEYPKALTDYNQALQINPQLADIYYNRSFVYYSLKQYDRAIADYKQAIKLNSQLAESHINPIANYNDLTQEGGQLQHNSQDAEAYLKQGVAYHELKQYDRAISSYDRAIEINPNYAPAYNHRGVAYFDLQEYPKAIADFNQALQINPSLANAYFGRGNAYRGLKEYSKAIADFNQALQINPSLANAYSNRGAAYGELKEYPKAIFDFNQALQINPSLANAYFGRGLAYAMLRNLQQGRKDLQQAAILFKQQNDLQQYQKIQQALKLLSQIESQQ